MKNILRYLLVFIVLFSFVGCTSMKIKNKELAANNWSYSSGTDGTDLNLVGVYEATPLNKDKIILAIDMTYTNYQVEDSLEKIGTKQIQKRRKYSGMDLVGFKSFCDGIAQHGLESYSECMNKQLAPRISNVDVYKGKKLNIKDNKKLVDGVFKKVTMEEQFSYKDKLQTTSSWTIAREMGGNLYVYYHYTTSPYDLTFVPHHNNLIRALKKQNLISRSSNVELNIFEVRNINLITNN